MERVAATRATECADARRSVLRLAQIRPAENQVNIRAALLGFVFPCLVESSCPPSPQDARGLPELTDHGYLESAEGRQDIPVVPRSSATFG
jgi:hypothetical protein